MSDFYKDKPVVILGGAGFAGSHLAEHLIDLGASVHVIDNLSRGNNVATSFTEYEFYKADITYKDTLEILLNRIKPFAAFNLTANVAGVEYNQNHHNEMFLFNVQLQTVPVQVCDRLNVPHYLQVSSVCVYGEDANNPAREDNLGSEPAGANAGYSWSKRMGERVVQWSNLAHAVIVRPSNVYGPGDWYDDKAHVIPKLIRDQVNGKAKYFAANAIREFIHVTDVAKGMAAALEHGKHKEAYNLGTHNMCSISMGNLHKRIAELTNTELPEPSEAPFDTGDSVRYSDCFKIHKFWQHEINLDNGLEMTVKDYMESKCKY